MSDGEGSAEGDARINKIFDLASGLEEVFITESEFGNKLDDSVKGTAIRIILMWDQYIRTKGLLCSPREEYALRHVAAIGDYLSGQTDFGKMWVITQKNTGGTYTAEDRKRAFTYISGYSKTELAQTLPQ